MSNEELPRAENEKKIIPNANNPKKQLSSKKKSFPDPEELKTQHHSLHLPHWIVILLLLFVPPVGWWHMWKNHRYHSWFPYVLWLNAAIMLGFATYILVHIYPPLWTLFDGVTYIFLAHIGLVMLALFEIGLGFYLVEKCKNDVLLRRRILGLVILLLFINAIALPISQFFMRVYFAPKKNLAINNDPCTEENRVHASCVKTYRSTDLGITFQYPHSELYELSEQTNTSVSFGQKATNGNRYITMLTISTDPTTFIDYSNLSPCKNLEVIDENMTFPCISRKVTPIEIDHIPAESFHVTYGNDNTKQIVQTTEKPNIELTLQTEGLDKEIDQILSSFRFTN